MADQAMPNDFGFRNRPSVLFQSKRTANGLGAENVHQNMRITTNPSTQTAKKILLAEL
jgi:hypothetical protein